MNQPFMYYKQSSNFERTYQKLNFKKKKLSKREQETEE